MCAGRQALGWLPHGYGPGLDRDELVAARRRRSRVRPPPVKFGSSGAGQRSRGGGSGRRRWPARSRRASRGAAGRRVSSSRPETVMRSPSGSPACWRVRSLVAARPGRRCAERRAPALGARRQVDQRLLRVRAARWTCRRVSSGGWKSRARRLTHAAPPPAPGRRRCRSRRRRSRRRGGAARGRACRGCARRRRRADGRSRSRRRWR